MGTWGGWIFFFRKGGTNTSTACSPRSSAEGGPATGEPQLPPVRENAMDLTPICSRCGKNMDLVVVIKPLGCQPGLNAYECPYCGHTYSRLTVQAG
jgi:hypothetical protein